MRLLLDTNVIIDILIKREPFFSDSYTAVRIAIEKDLECFVSTTAVTDIFYILRKNLNSIEEAKNNLNRLAQLVSFADVSSSDVIMALSSKISDYEDAVVDEVAKKIDADYIITRNVKDFDHSKVKAITPTKFIQTINSN